MFFKKVDDEAFSRQGGGSGFYFGGSVPVFIKSDPVLYRSGSGYFLQKVMMKRSQSREVYPVLFLADLYRFL